MIRLDLLKHKLIEKLPELRRELEEYPGLKTTLINALMLHRPSLSTVKSILSDSSIYGKLGDIAEPTEEWIGNIAIKSPIPSSMIRPYASKGITDFINGLSILSVDTSEFTEKMLIPRFLIVNVGYTYITYVDKTVEFNSEPYVYVEKELRSINGIYEHFLDVHRVKAERDVILKIHDKYKPSRLYLLLDETLSLNYTITFSKSRRDIIIDEFKKSLNEFKNRSIIPIGIFYSLAGSVRNTIIKSILCKNFSCLKCDRKPVCLEYLGIIDRVIFNSILNIGDRSQVFREKSQVTENYNLEVYFFYVKTGENDILRVEVPGWGLNNIGEIHKIVIVQSILGGGYPYLMSKSHEQATLRTDRKALMKFIEEVVMNGRYEDKYLFKLTTKYKRKFKGIV